jgi:succinate-semialdehyde dehydrogenase / glutarate-semialdehyde dehydrogenase
LEVRERRKGVASGQTAHSYTDRIPVDLSKLVDLITKTGDDHGWRDVKMPINGEVIGRVPDCGADDVRLALKRARSAQKSWGKTTYEERKSIICRFHDIILDNKNKLADLLQIETGKARMDAIEEVLDIVNVSRYYAYHGEEIIRPKRRSSAIPFFLQVWEYNHPLGVVGVIVPWNYPLTISMTDPIPAILAGNTVVVKPAKETPFIALYAMQLLLEAGLPPDVYQIVTGEGSTIGTPLIEGSNFLMFTGSTETGRIVGRQAGENLIDFTAELGGKNPVIVLNDANLNNSVQGIVRGSFANAGQLCISFERVYIQSGIYDSFVNKLIEETSCLQPGFSLDMKVDFGSLINQDQLERVSKYVDDAVAKGARVLFGGKHAPDLGPYFYEPTILEGVTPEMDIYTEEAFGPVISLYPFDEIEAVVEAANASRYGLNAAVWAGNSSQGRRIASQIQCGTVSVNDSYIATWGSVDAPMGGMKDSGIGRRHGREGILKYTQSQMVAVQRGVPFDYFKKINPVLFVLGLVLYLIFRKRIFFLR